MIQWKKILTQNIRSRNALIQLLQLDEHHAKKLSEQPFFAYNVPLRIAQKMSLNNLRDPLFLQYVGLKPSSSHPEFSSDPVCDQAFKQSDKLLKKYNGRALLVCTSACAMHCRYCFRQNFPYETKNKTFEKELLLIAEDSSIHEIILSGGDPLSLDDRIIQTLIKELEKIPHVKIIRFHTRFILGIPERITFELLEILKTTSLQIVFVVHINHVKELDADIFASCKKIQALGIPILCQSVLLKGINDSYEALYSLYMSLIHHGIIPYYLHQLDKVEGAQDYYVEKTVGIELIKRLRASLPGYGVPRFAAEIPHKANKTILY